MRLAASLLYPLGVSDDQRVNSLLEISNAMVAIYKDRFGRGPRSARTHWAGPDALTVVLEETLTPAERSLVQMGEHQRLRDTRLFFQYASVESLCGAVEEITGRKVRAFVSGMDTRVDGLAIENFILHPVGYEGPSRTDLGQG